MASSAVVNCFFKKTRKHNVVQILNERYLREDIPCGNPACLKCQVLLQSLANSSVHVTTAPHTLAVLSATPPSGHYVVLDTNCAFKQIDLLERSAGGFADVVVCSTVLQELKHLSPPVYDRLRKLISDPTRRFYVFSNENHRETYVDRLPGETPNDRNDRAIRVVCQWYKLHMENNPSHTSVIMVTNDREQSVKSKNEGIEAMTVKAYVAKFLAPHHPELMDVLVEPESTSSTVPSRSTSPAGMAPSGRKASTTSGSVLFDDFRPMSELLQGIKAGTLHQGSIHVSRSNYLEATVFSQSTDASILIQGRTDINRVIDGDIVAVEIYPEDQWKVESALIVEGDEQEDVAQATLAAPAHKGVPKKPTGRVVGVIKRTWKPYCGSVEAPRSTVGAAMGNVATLLFRAMDSRIPKIRIRTRQAQALIGKRIVIAVDTWERNSMYPTGHFVRDLGAIGDKEAETEAILLTNDIPYKPFTDAVLGCLPQLPWKFDVARDMTRGRVDFRDRRVCSVDPVGCKDIDDALHVCRLNNGNFEVGVHIADVTHFMLEGSALDLEAADRGTSVYLADRRIDMLPKPLTEDICSLRSNVERLAFSVVWEMNSKAEVVNTKYCKSVILSRHSFSYEEAQSWIDDKARTDDLTNDLRDIMALSKQLRARRLESGALVLASAQLKFSKDENYNPVDVELYELHETNQMVEEFMLLANISVAEKIHKSFPSYAVLRRHPAPDPHSFEALQVVMKARGYHSLDVATSSSLSASLDAINDPQDPFINTLIRMLATRCMQQARYFSSGSVASFQEFYHYGLAAPIYTHFTSPIRRYADDLVHRLLAFAINVQPVSRNYNNATIGKICDNLNRRHTQAQRADRASAELHTIVLFRGKTLIEPGYITRLCSNGFLVYVPKYALESIVYVCESGETANPWVLDETAQTLSCPSRGLTVTVMQKVTVKITVTEDNPHSQKMVIACLDPEIVLLASDKTKKRVSSEAIPKSPASKKKAPAVKSPSVETLLEAVLPSSK